MRETSEIKAYVRHCRALLHDIDLALRDLEDREQGWRFHYAVDFSEIHAFVLPEESHEAASQEDVLQEFFILSRLFGERGILLPEPYAVELSGFFENLATKELSNAATRYIEVLKDVQNVLALPKTERLLHRARDVDASALTTAEVEEIFGFFAEFAPNLVAFARGFDLTPFDRLRNLLRNRQFAALEEVVPELFERVDEARQRAWFIALTERRKNAHAASTYVDALALEHVQAANEVLRERKERVLLVSRSSHMAAVLSAFAETPRDVFIRHPRSLPLVFDAATAPSREELNARRASLEAFIEAAEEAFRRGSPDANRQRSDDTLQHMVQRLREEWASVGQYTTALTSHGETEPDKQSKREVVIGLLSAMRERGQLQERARAEIRAILRDVRRGHDAAAFLLQSGASPPARGSVPYAIEFEDVRLRAVTARVSETWSASLADAESIFEEATGVEDEYECLLGIAVSLGAMGQWRLARHYIDYALTRRADRGRREGRFLRAVIYNRMTMEAESFAAGVNRLSRALESVNAAIAEGGAPDPRYLNERAVTKMRLLELARSTGEELIDRHTFTVEQAVADLEEALAAEMSPKLRLQILNNLSYAHLVQDDRESLATRVGQLESALRAAYHDPAEWPAFVTDTIVYAGFRLHDRPTSELLRKWSQELAGVAARGEVSYQESRVIRAHAAEIENALRSREE